MSKRCPASPMLWGVKTWKLSRHLPYHVDPDDWATLLLIGAVVRADARHQRRVHAAKTSEAMQRHQRGGRRMSAPDRTPYGQRVDPNDPALLVDNPEEQAVIRRIVAEQKAGRGLREIARGLTRDGVPCRGKSRWHHVAVGRILKRFERGTERGTAVS